METVTLWCAVGDHSWQRERQRGRPPFSCPEHSEVPKTPRTRKPSPEPAEAVRIVHRVLQDYPQVSTARRLGIQQILDAREGCLCEIRSDMSDRELMRVVSCQPKWVCSTLDKIRRLYCTYTS